MKTDAETKKASRRYTKTAVNLRKGIGTTFDALKVLPKEAEVSVLEIKGKWSRVQIDNQNSGWIADRTLCLYQGRTDRYRKRHPQSHLDNPLP